MQETTTWRPVHRHVDSSPGVQATFLRNADSLSRADKPCAGPPFWRWSFALRSSQFPRDPIMTRPRSNRWRRPKSRSSMMAPSNLFRPVARFAEKARPAETPVFHAPRHAGNRPGVPATRNRNSSLIAALARPLCMGDASLCLETRLTLRF